MGNGPHLPLAHHIDAASQLSYCGHSCTSQHFREMSDGSANLPGFRRRRAKSPVATHRDDTHLNLEASKLPAYECSFILNAVFAGARVQPVNVVVFDTKIVEMPDQRVQVGKIGPEPSFSHSNHLGSLIFG